MGIMRLMYVSSYLIRGMIIILMKHFIFDRSDLPNASPEGLSITAAVFKFSLHYSYKCRLQTPKVIRFPFQAHNQKLSENVLKYIT
jgi:hypothetical protein